MVHLAPDSRILVSLVKQEQAYAVQLHNLLNASGASLSALAVYASSSPPALSPVLNRVAGALSGADEALRTYGEAVNDWIDELSRIKQKEEEVTNIGRDREILVTRLLKISQKSKSPPPSLLNAAPDSSSASFATFNSKVNNAQTELQACESRLAEKERELERVRIHAIKQGLKLRCSALVQCSHVWNEMGGRALKMLDGIDVVNSSANGHATEFFKPLPDPVRDNDRDSLLSSLAPSQSASQIGAASPFPSAPFPPDKYHRLNVPPPHLVSDHNVIPQTSRENSSSSSENEGPVEVHENPKFVPTPIFIKNKKNTWTTSSSPARGSPIPFPSTSSDIGSSSKSRLREKKRTGIFGNIAALFRTSVSPKAGTQRDGPWSSRTDHNLRSAKTDGEQSSDDDITQPRSGRLRKGRNRTVVPSDRMAPRASDDGDASHRSDSAIAPLRRKRKAKLDNSGTVRSTVSEPPPEPRLRANTLSTVSPGAAFSSASSHRHGRTASMDGRWGTTGDKMETTSMQTWRAKAKGESLMRIVEGPSTEDPLSRLEVVRAPGSTLPRMPLLVHPPQPLPSSASAPSSPVTPKASTNKRASMPVPTMITPGILTVPAPGNITEKKPLRSALRKSPSPSASPNAQAAKDGDQSPSMTPLSLPAPSSLSRSPRPVLSVRSDIPSTIMESPRQSVTEPTAKRQSFTDDSASISSYETGHENLDEEGTEDLHAQAPGPSPFAHPPSENVAPLSPHGPGSHESPQANHNELSSTTSTDTTGPTRRKSVRMSSLPPQVSATPPALDEYNDTNHAPWQKPQQNLVRAETGQGWQTRIPASEGALSWEDSSSEDETYKAARRALSLASRRPGKKGKR